MAEGNLPDRFHVQGHRGACAEAQENTLPSFEKAIEAGADTVEFDVHLTKDGVLVLHHDFILDPKYTHFTNGKPIPAKVAIRNLTYKEIQSVRIEDTRRIKTPHTLTEEETRIPTLEEVFNLFKNSKNPHAKEMLLDIEMKSEADHPEWTPAPSEFARAVLTQIENHWDFSRVVVRSFDHRVLQEAKKIRPGITIAALTNTGFKDYVQVMKDLKPTIMSPEKNSMTKSQLTEVQALGAKVVPFTVNTKEDWERMINMGMDGVTTDDPRGLIKYLEEKQLRNLSLTAFKTQIGCSVLGTIR